MPYQIEIEELELSAHLGVPEEERAQAQRLTVTVRLEIAEDTHGLGDEIGRTVDYFQVAKAVQAEAKRTPRRLLETLADDLASMVLERFPVSAVDLKVRKYILPDARSVAVILQRARPQVP